MSGGASAHRLASPTTIKRRSDFLRLRGGVRWTTVAFLIETKPRARVAGLIPDDVQGPRFGFTVTKKLGKAHDRNRIRRRLKEAVRLAAPGRAKHEHDYVVVAREAALTLPFAELVNRLADSLERLHRAGRPATTPKRPGRPPETT